ncbi:hypothetical protein RHECNPAF_1340079 [Rhizobium etli CNPAF512]|nr:hypothetical protein RHECNPAF_1340079 [Rhizobium etli CNPAF512]
MSRGKGKIPLTIYILVFFGDSNRRAKWPPHAARRPVQANHPLSVRSTISRTSVERSGARSISISAERA